MKLPTDVVRTSLASVFVSHVWYAHRRALGPQGTVCQVRGVEEVVVLYHLVTTEYWIEHCLSTERTGSVLIL